MRYEQPELMGDPLAEIESLRARAMAMGANDSEAEQFNSIVKKLTAGKYKDPEEAVQEARAIVEAKQDYH